MASIGAGGPESSGHGGSTPSIWYLVRVRVRSRSRARVRVRVRVRVWVRVGGHLHEARGS